MSNVYMLKDIKDRGGSKGAGHQLGSAYEEDVEKKLYSAFRSKAEINDLSEGLLTKISEYSEREEEFQRISTDVKNKISRLNAVNTRLRTRLTSKQISHNELEAKCSAEIKLLKSSIKSLKGEATLAQKASFLDKVKIISLEAKIDELEAELENLKQEWIDSPPRASQDSNIVRGLLEEPPQINSSEIDSLRLELGQVKENLNSKKHEIECIEKGIKATDTIYKQELDRLSSLQLNLIEENSHLRGLVLKKDNEAVPEGSAEHVPPITSDAKEKESEQVLKEPQLSTLNPPPSQIFSVGGAEAKSLLATTSTIAGSLMMPMIIYSILTLLLIAIIWIVVGKKL
ncbi:23053_t:CDS:1 [Dentiscutata erythropus]|uniref:23053_t:CDS:1 n=1 Tax=Dentiscutata erythropus TaxID=1348616 RepID=A0A9N9GWZ2_9GLOM|nr:23053_t:CDS:1 [Dentiscutata erythropus]